MQTVKDTQKELKSQFERYRNAHREYVLLLENDAIVEDELKIMHNIQQMYVEVNLEAGAKIEKEEIKNQETKSSTYTDLKMERMKMPSFGGQIRDYPRFKSDFDQHVMPAKKSDDSTAYVLRSCLTGEPLELVKNVGDNLMDMWSRLDERFGKTSKITDAIMYDIKQLKPVSDGDDRKFIDLVNTVERSYRDLSTIGMRAEMANSTIISLIEERMPHTTKNMWCLELSDKDSRVDDRNKYPYLLESLLKHRRAIEYGSSDLRSKKSTKNATEAPIHHLKREKESTEEREKSSTFKDQKRHSDESTKGVYCWYHSSNKHVIVNCSAYLAGDVRSRWQMVLEYRACLSSLITGHRKSHCYKLRECGIRGCKEMHHPTLHEDKSVKNYVKEATKYNTQDDQVKKESGASTETEDLKQHHLKSRSQKKICLLQLMKMKAGLLDKCYVGQWCKCLNDNV